jgi:RNA polymerase sigma-70 factor (ECF subfamily)
MPHSADLVRRFLKLFLAHETDLRAYVNAVVREASARDDVFQEVALALWRSFDRFDGDRPFAAWARGVATHKVLDFQRRSTRRAVVLSAAAIDTVHRAFDEMPPCATARQAALDECLKRLPAKSSELLALRYMREVSIPEIAAQLGTSAAAIHQSLSRVRVALGRCIEHRLTSDNQSIEQGFSTSA